VIRFVQAVYGVPSRHVIVGVIVRTMRTFRNVTTTPAAIG
jgi:hypothetical protein